MWDTKYDLHDSKRHAVTLIHRRSCVVSFRDGWPSSRNRFSYRIVSLDSLWFPSGPSSIRRRRSRHPIPKRSPFRILRSCRCCARSGCTARWSRRCRRPRLVLPVSGPRTPFFPAAWTVYRCHGVYNNINIGTYGKGRQRAFARKQW